MVDKAQVRSWVQALADEHGAARVAEAAAAIAADQAAAGE